MKGRETHNPSLNHIHPRPFRSRDIPYETIARHEIAHYTRDEEDEAEASEGVKE